MTDSEVTLDLKHLRAVCEFTGTAGAGVLADYRTVENLEVHMDYLAKRRKLAGL